MTVGVIADTHGVLLPEALEALRGSELIVHAGDVGSLAILRRLEEVAPVLAVYGNNDDRPVRDACPPERLVTAGGIAIGVIHGDRWPPARRLTALAGHFADRGARVIVYGHTHRALVQELNGVMIFNPGAAGKRTFGNKLSVGRLTISGGTVEAAVIPIEP